MNIKETNDFVNGLTDDQKGHLMRTILRRHLYILTAACGLLILFPGLAFAGSEPPLPRPQLLNSTQFYAMLLAAAVPAVTYVLNFYAPWASDKIKSLVLVVAAAAVGAITQLIDRGSGSMHWDTNTLETIGFAVVAALAAHAGFWTRSTFAAALGAGQNAQDQPRR